MIEIKIVRNEKEREEYLSAESEKMMAGHVEKGKLTVVLTPELFAKIFSPCRLEMLMAMARKRKDTITELAHRLKRPFEVVHRDLQLFEQFGLVKLHKEKKQVFPTRAGNIHLPMIEAC